MFKVGQSGANGLLQLEFKVAGGLWVGRVQFEGGQGGRRLLTTQRLLLGTVDETQVYDALEFGRFLYEILGEFVGLAVVVIVEMNQENLVCLSTLYNLTHPVVLGQH